MVQFAAVAVLFLLQAPPVSAQATLGGHIGTVIPWVTHAGGTTTNISDNVVIGFPVGITIKGQGRAAFDLEFIPFFQQKPHQVTLTVHPGVVWSLGHGYAAGIRAAFDVNSSQLGFTPLVNKSWPIKNGGLVKSFFVEADLPVRFNRPTFGPATNPVTFATHIGFGF